MTKRILNIGNLQVYQGYSDEFLDWYAAKDKCQEIGKGWRLPEEEEIKYIKEFYDLGILNVESPDDKPAFFWLGEIPVVFGRAFKYNFKNDYLTDSNKIKEYNLVLPVRKIKLK